MATHLDILIFIYNHTLHSFSNVFDTYAITCLNSRAGFKLTFQFCFGEDEHDYHRFLREHPDFFIYV